MGFSSQCNNTYRRRRRYFMVFLPFAGWKMESNKFRTLHHKMNLFANETSTKKTLGLDCILDICMKIGFVVACQTVKMDPSKP